MQELVREITPNLKLLLPNAPLPGFEDFLGTYLFQGEKNALIDIGPKVAIPGLILALKAVGLHPTDIDYIILTHIHIDHAGGTGTALKEMKNARVVVHPRGRSHLIEPTALWKASIDTLGELALNYGEIEPVPEDKILVAQDGMKLELGAGVVLEIVNTPGHSAHHLSVFEPGNRVLAAGDAAGIFTRGFLRLTTPPPLRITDYIASLDKLISLNPKILCYAHLGGFDNAVERLNTLKSKLLFWYEVVQDGVKAGKDAQAIYEVVKQKDAGLNSYLATLNKARIKRDYTQVINNIIGLMSSPPLKH